VADGGIARGAGVDIRDRVDHPRAGIRAAVTVLLFAQAQPEQRPRLPCSRTSSLTRRGDWPWLTKMKVMPSCRWICLSSTCIRCRSLRSSVPIYLAQRLSSSEQPRR